MNTAESNCPDCGCELCQCPDEDVLTECRQRFEELMGQPPYEVNLRRCTEESAWPGNYRDYKVQLAWCAWEELWKHCAELESRIQQLTGKKFSDRMYPAMEAKLATAEADIKVHRQLRDEQHQRIAALEAENRRMQEWRKLALQYDGERMTHKATIAQQAEQLKDCRETIQVLSRTANEKQKQLEAAQDECYRLSSIINNEASPAGHILRLIRDKLGLAPGENVIYYVEEQGRRLAQWEKDFNALEQAYEKLLASQEPRP